MWNVVFAMHTDWITPFLRVFVTTSDVGSPFTLVVYMRYDDLPVLLYFMVELTETFHFSGVLPLAKRTAGSACIGIVLKGV